jgi:MoxR-like ATPase
LLRGLVDWLAAAGQGGAVLIEGVAGIGKSSLLQALVAAVSVPVVRNQPLRR